MRKKQLMEEFQVSRAFVDKKVQGIENEVQFGRYNRYTILDGAVNVYAFIYYWKLKNSCQTAMQENMCRRSNRMRL